MQITAQTMRRAEVWSDYQCAGGKRLAVLGGLTACLAAGTISGEDRLTLALGASDPSADFVLDRRVIRIVESDNVFDEWRIVDIARDSRAGRISVTCAPVDVDLVVGALVGQTDGAGVVRYDFDAVGLLSSALIDTFVLPALSSAGRSWVTRGTIDVDQPRDLTFAWDTSLSVLRRLAETLALELQVRRNGTTGYYVDLLTAIGAAAPVADFRYRKNLPGLTQTASMVGAATRVYPKGAIVDGYAATMANARWKVTAVDSGTRVVTLADPAGGNGPIAFDAQLNGLLFRKVTGAYGTVQASSASAQTVTLDDAGAIAVGDIVWFTRADGADLTYLDAPAEISALGGGTAGVVVGVAERADVPATENLIPNAVCRDWPSGTLPVGWTAVGAPTLSKNTAAPYVSTGGASIRVQAAAAALGVQSPAGKVYPSARLPYGSGFGHLWIVSGKVRVELVITKADASTAILPVAPNVASSAQLGQFVDLGVSGENLQALGAVSVAVRVVSHEGAAEFYLDAVQATNTASQEPLVEGSGGTKLWQAANEQLRRNGGPIVSLDAVVVDLARLDTAAWGDDCAIVQGGTVRIVDPRLDPVEPPNRLDATTAAMGTDASADGVVDGWVGISGGAAVVGSRTRDTTGQGAQRIEVTTGPTVAGGAYYGVQLAASIPVKAGDIAEVEIETIVDSFVGGGRAQLYTVAGTVEGGVSTQAAAWTKLQRPRFVVPAGATMLMVQAYVSMPSINDTATVRFRHCLVRITNAHGVTTTRVIAFDRDYLTPGNTTITLSSRPEDLVGDLARPTAAARRQPAVADASNPSFASSATDKLAAPKYRAAPSVDLVLVSAGAYRYQYMITGRDPDGEQVRIRWRTVPTTAPSNSTSTWDSETALQNQPHSETVTVARPGPSAASDRFLEAWAVDASGNVSFIARAQIGKITASDAENALTSVVAAGNFEGVCPTQNLVDTITWTEHADIAAAAGWVVKVFHCSSTATGCAPGTLLSGDATSGITFTVVTGMKPGTTSNRYRNYKVQLVNPYGDLIDEDTTVELFDQLDAC